MPSLAEMLPPGLAGFEVARQRNEDRSRRNFAQGVQTVGLLAALQKQAQEQELRAALASGDTERLKRTPGGLAALQQLSNIEENQAQTAARRQKAAEDARKAAFYSPQNRAQYVEGGTPALPASIEEPPTPATPGQFNFDRFLQDAASQGVVNPETYATHRAAEATKNATLEATTEARRARIEQNAANAQMLHETRLAAAKTAEERNAEIARANRVNEGIQRELLALRRENAGTPPVAIQDPNSPTGYRYGTRQQALGQPAPAPFAQNLGNWERNVSKDFEAHPQVKAFMDLVPDVDVVNNYMGRRAGVPVSERAVFDKNLVNTYLRVTHPKGDQISNFERKDLAGLPALPDRIQRAVEGFFTGSFIPDDVARDMSKVIGEKFNARRSVVADIENKAVEDVKRRGGNPDFIRKVTRGQVLPAPENPAERKADTIYQTPRGPMKWTGTGWLPAN